ncbi:MAG: hypothetical protein WCP28_11710 [Actinomycetes bacterium]
MRAGPDLTERERCPRVAREHPDSPVHLRGISQTPTAAVGAEAATTPLLTLPTSLAMNCRVGSMLGNPGCSRIAQH